MEIPHTLEPQPNPKHKMGFLLDLLLTLKCNYDCSYCGPEENGWLPGHDNSKSHPDQDVCLTMLEQGLRYVDTYMEIRKPNMRSASLNMYGGEALYRKDIEHILERSSQLYKPYENKWTLKRTLTTNASCDLGKWKNVTDHLEYITFSYHSEGPAKLQDNFFRNIEHTHNQKKNYSAIVLMYPEQWQRCIYTLDYLQRRGYNVRPKLLDGHKGVYTKEQLRHCFDVMKEKDYSLLDDIEGKQIMTKFRACCGGRPLCVNRNFKEPRQTVPREDWLGWKCSVNHFFLMANCQDRKFYTNKDCHVRPDGTRGHVADIDTMPQFIEENRARLAKTKEYFYTCVQKRCICGTCAPKSLTQQGLAEVMKSYNG